MNWIIDILLVAVFLFFACRYTIKGLAHTLNKFSETWLAIIITLVISPLLTGWLKTIFFDWWVTDTIHGFLIQYIEGNGSGYNLAQLFENIPTGLNEFLHTLNADLVSLEAEFGSYSVASEEIVWAMAERIGAPVIKAITSIIGLIVGFIIPRYVFRVLGRWIQRKERSKFISAIDHIIGFIFGVAFAYIVVFLVALGIRTGFRLTYIFNPQTVVMGYYYKSYVFKWLCETNMLQLIFSFL